MGKDSQGHAGQTWCLNSRTCVCVFCVYVCMNNQETAPDALRLAMDKPPVDLEVVDNGKPVLVRPVTAKDILEIPHAERPRFPCPLLKRTRGPDTSSKATQWVKAHHEGALTPPRGPDPSSKATLWVKAQHEGALPPPCSVRPEFTQTHVHRVGDAIQPSHPLSSPSPPAPSPSQHQ